MSRRAVSEARGAASARRLPRPAPARSLSCIPIVTRVEHCPTKGEPSRGNSGHSNTVQPTTNHTTK